MTNNTTTASKPNAASSGTTTSTTAKNVQMEYHYYKTRWCKTVEKYHKECPYETRCMFAHSEEELRTEEQNIAEGLVTAEAVRDFQRRLQQAEKKRAKRKLKRESGEAKPKQSQPKLQQARQQEQKKEEEVPQKTSASTSSQELAPSPARNHPNSGGSDADGEGGFSCNLSVASAPNNETPAEEPAVSFPEFTYAFGSSAESDASHFSLNPHNAKRMVAALRSSTPGGMSDSDNQSYRLFGDRIRQPDELLELSSSFSQYQYTSPSPAVAPPTQRGTVFTHNPYSIDTPFITKSVVGV